MEKIETAGIPSTPFGFIWYAIKPYKKWVFFSVVFSFLQQLFGDLQSYAFKGFVDSASLFEQGQVAQGEVIFWIALVPVLLLLSVLSIRANGFLVNYWTVHSRTGAVKILFSYLSQHSSSYFNDRFSGALSSKVNIVSGNVSKLTNQIINSLLSVVFSFTVTLFLIASASQALAVAFMIGVAILVPFNYFLTRKQMDLSSKMVEMRTKLQGYVIDAISNISAVQQYARRQYEIDRIGSAIENYRKADVDSDNFREKVLITNNIIVWIFISFIIMWTFNLWSDGRVTAGELIMVTTLTLGFMGSLTHIGQNLNNIMESYGEVREGLKEIIRPHDIVDSVGSSKLAVRVGDVIFKEVSFAYNESGKIFNSLSFSVKGGEKVGIVGTSGAGKSTLMKILLRQYDVLDGSVLIDDQDIREVTQESLRENVSIVPQEPMLFHRTVRENIMYGKLDASEEEMIEVAKKAQAHDFIEQLPQKYDSLVGERGVKLSVGQRQRIAIARAFLKNAPILILDEATSALDSESEVAVQKTLQALMEGKTVFAIAHRLSTLREMDRILVFKDGQIVEDGTHRSLLKNKEGVYASFWNHQAGGFIKED